MGGLGERSPLTGPSISCYELWHQKGAIIFFSNTWQMMHFLNPLHAMIPKILFSFFFAEFGIRVTSGVVSVGFWGGCQLRPFGGREGSSQRVVSHPPPPELKTRPPMWFSDSP